MENPFIYIDAENINRSAFETKPIEGYEFPENKTTGEKFPNCCLFHKNAYEKSVTWFELFPNCCDQHKAMQGKSWFNKKNYERLPVKIVNQLSFTQYHISQQFNLTDWYKDITDYIEYNIYSFGQPAIGLHQYLHNLKDFLNAEEVEKRIPKDKLQKLIDYIESYDKPVQTPKTDFNILISTYQKWLKIFPFELSYFKELKVYFEKNLPFLAEKPEYNKYTNLSKAKMQTQAGLVEGLINATKLLLQKINSKALLGKGIITDTKEHRLDLINENHRIKQESLLAPFSKKEFKYIKILKQWLHNEKEYFKEISALINKNESSDKTNEKQKPQSPVKPPLSLIKPELHLSLRIRGLCFAKNNLRKRPYS